MRDERVLRKKGSHWLLAVPREVRAWLGISHPVKVSWHWGRRGEATITVGEKRPGGRPPVAQLARDLAEARAEIVAVRERDQNRDRSMYAEGFAHGYLQCYERIYSPGGPSAERAWRRRLWAFTFPDAARVAEPTFAGPAPAPSKPRPNARTRRAKKLLRVDAPILGPDDQPPPDPSPSPSEQGSPASGAASPQAAHT